MHTLLILGFILDILGIDVNTKGLALDCLGIYISMRAESAANENIPDQRPGPHANSATPRRKGPRYRGSFQAADTAASMYLNFASSNLLISAYFHDLRCFFFSIIHLLCEYTAQTQRLYRVAYGSPHGRRVLNKHRSKYILNAMDSRKNCMSATRPFSRMKNKKPGIHRCFSVIGAEESRS